MRIRIFFIFIKLLQHYSSQRKDRDLVVSIDPDWKYYILRPELIEILNRKLGADVHHLALTGATSEQLLEHIGDERYIIDFFLSILQKMVRFNDTPTLDENLLDVLLNQTGQQSHYLRDKGSDKLDEYDLSNLNTILRKAGWLRKVYGVFDSEAPSNEASSDAQVVYYDTHTEAMVEVSRRVNEENIPEDKLKVMSKEVLIPII